MKILAFTLAGMLAAAGARAQTYNYVVTAPFGGYVIGPLLSGSVGDTLVAEGWGAYLLRTGSGGSDTPIPPPPSNQIQIIAAVGTGQSDGIPLRAVRTIITGTQFNGSPSSVQESVTCREVANLGIAQRGTFVATGATPVAVAFAGLKSTMVISVSLNTAGGTVGARPTIQTITPGTGFTVAATAGDTSTYNWIAE